MTESRELRKKFFERLLLQSKANGYWGRDQIAAAKALLEAIEREEPVAVDAKSAAANDV